MPLNQEEMGMDAMGGAEQVKPGQDEGSFWLPADFPGAESLKPGDSITLKVVARDEETGEVEVSHDGTESNPEWKTDLRESLTGPSEEPTEE